MYFMNMFVARRWLLLCACIYKQCKIYIDDGVAIPPVNGVYMGYLHWLANKVINRLDELGFN